MSNGHGPDTLDRLPVVVAGKRAGDVVSAHRGRMALAYPEK
jgi:hypothetical protein